VATDSLALIAIFGFSGALAAFAWFERPPPTGAEGPDMEASGSL
jgi:hypothetical protein